MAQWRIKQISDLTNISIRMLRHYDKIGLLKPDTRSDNKYRCYSEQDLANLQQIIALKYFGFSLATIKSMLEKNHTIVAHLQAQHRVIQVQAEHLTELNSALTSILSQIGPSGIPEASDLITLINRYNMTKNLKKSWAGQNLSEQQFADYVAIYELHPKEFAAWDQIIEQINRGEMGDPEGPDGERVVKIQREIIMKTKDSLAQQRYLSSEVLADIKSGKISKLQFTPEGGMWLAKAGLCYWLKQWESVYDDIVSKINTDPHGEDGQIIAKRWRFLIDEMLFKQPRDLAVGTMLWQVLAQQKTELDEVKTPPTPQELLKKAYVKLIFNPEAMKWLEQALDWHQTA